MEKKPERDLVEEGKVHHGENIRIIRTTLNVKQDVLGYALGQGWSQKTVSLMEARSKLPMHTITVVAKALGVPPDIILNCMPSSFVDALKICSKIEVVENLASPTEQILSLTAIVEAMNEQKRLIKLLLERENEQRILFENFLKTHTSATETTFNLNCITDDE